MNSTIKLISIDALFTSLVFTFFAIISIKVLSLGSSDLLDLILYSIVIVTPLWGVLYRNKLYTASLHNNWAIALFHGISVTFLTGFSIAIVFSLFFFMSPSIELSDKLSLFSFIFIAALFSVIMAAPFGMAASILVYYRFKLSNKSSNLTGANDAPSS